MDIQKIKMNGSIVYTIFILLVVNFVFVSCEGEQGQNNGVFKSLGNDTDLGEAARQLYEYDQFLTNVWQELNRLSDNMAELQINKENYAYNDRRTKMLDIEEQLQKIEASLSSVKHADKAMIDKLQNAINRKNQNIKVLKKQIEKLEKENIALNKNLEERELALINRENEIKRLEAQHQRTIAESYESIGDALRWSVINIGAYHGTGNLKRVKEAQLEILRQSIKWYEKAYKKHSTSAIYNKINKTIIGFNKYSESNKLDDLRF